MYRSLFLTIVVLCGGCSAASHYAKTNVGNSLDGKIIVEWMAPDLFLFTPSEEDPLVFVRSDGSSVRPERMLTDGGSIPRPLWALRNFSPWGYGPAFIVHDWLFHMQDCKLAGYEDWTIDSAATVMSEVMKTMMEDPKFDYGDSTTVYLMYKAVKSPPAQAAWEDSNCRKPPPPAADWWRPTERFVVDFGG